MNPSKVREKLGRGQTAFGTSLQFVDPVVFEMTASLGLDAIWLDMEHHSLSDAQAGNLIRAARAGGVTDVVVRPAKGEFMRAARMLEAGAHGIMYPRCESRAEAEELVRWAKFAPVGERGFDGAGADSDYMALPMVDYIQRANRNTFLIVQVEEERALDRCEELIAVDGIDMLMLGPADFTLLSHRPGEFTHPSVAAAFRRVADAAKSAGKHWGTTSTSLDHARELAQMGAGLVFHGADIVFVRREMTAMLQALRQFSKESAVAETTIQPGGVSCAGGPATAPVA